MTSTPHLDAIVFGGTFDPPHLGHIETVRLVRERFPKARLIVLPAAAPALARGDQKPGPAASFAQRLEMCRLAFAPFADVEVSSLEKDLPAPNYTVKTLALLQRMNPNAKLGWIMGADQLRSFPRWHDPARILTLAHVIVLPRADDHPTAKDVAAVLNEMNLEPSWAKRMTVLTMAPPPYASRLIREGLQARGRVEGLPGAVAAYIEDQHLYR